MYRWFSFGNKENFVSKITINKEVDMKYKNIVGAVIMALLFTAAHATVWYVHPDSAQNCIQDCLDSCSTGDTVLVGEGTYYESITWPDVQG